MQNIFSNLCMQCDSTEAVRSFFEHDVVGSFQAVITEGCLSMTEAVAGISRVFNVTQVSCIISN